MKTDDSNTQWRRTADGEQSHVTRQFKGRLWCITRQLLRRGNGRLLSSGDSPPPSSGDCRHLGGSPAGLYITRTFQTRLVIWGFFAENQWTSSSSSSSSFRGEWTVRGWLPPLNDDDVETGSQEEREMAGCVYRGNRRGSTDRAW